MLAAEMGGRWAPLLALAFDLGCDLVMADWEAEIARNLTGERDDKPEVKTKSLSPEEAWALL